MVKDSYYSVNSRSDNSWLFWKTTPSGQRVPVEFSAQKYLTGGDERYNTILYHGSMMCGGRVARLYMEFAPFGDLHGATLYPRDAWRRTGLVPESFCWNVFHAMAHVIESVTWGSPLDRKNKADERQTYLHRDLKPGNMLLVAARDKTSQSLKHPTPVVADWGLAVPTEMGHPSIRDTNDEWKSWFDKNGLRYVSAGTRGYRAPEML